MGMYSYSLLPHVRLASFPSLFEPVPAALIADLVRLSIQRHNPSSHHLAEPVPVVLTADHVRLSIHDHNPSSARPVEYLFEVELNQGVLESCREFDLVPAHTC